MPRVPSNSKRSRATGHRAQRSGYLHGYTATEQDRLYHQAAFLADAHKLIATYYTMENPTAFDASRTQIAAGLARAVRSGMRGM